MIKVGIVGTGKTFGIADYHAMGLVHDGRAKIAAVYNSTKESGLKWVARHGFNAKVCSSSQELLDIVDAVCICTPNAYHYQYAKEAIENSKDILIEKPLALTTEQCKELALLANGYPYIVVTPAQIKKFETGSGTSKKGNMVKNVFKNHKFDTSSDNIADACAAAYLCKGYFEWLKNKRDDFLKYQLEVLKGIKTKIEQPY